MTRKKGSDVIVDVVEEMRAAGYDVTVTETGTDVTVTVNAPEDATPLSVRERRREKLLCVLSQERHIEVAQEMAEAVREVRRLEDEKKRVMAGWKARIDEKEREVENLGKVVAAGEEEREVEVEDIYDFALGIVKSVRLDTGVAIKSRPMSDHDRQQLLPVAEQLAADDACDDGEMPVGEDEGEDEGEGEDDTCEDGGGPLEVPADPWAD